MLGAARQLPYSGHGGPTFDTGRLAGVIRLMREKSEWPQKPTNGRAWGMAAHFTFGSYVAHAVELSLDQMRALPCHEQITQHFRIQGWSGVAKWGGVSMATILKGSSR